MYEYGQAFSNALGSLTGQSAFVTVQVLFPNTFGRRVIAGN
jgi:hypothetical protein